MAKIFSDRNVLSLLSLVVTLAVCVVYLVGWVLDLPLTSRSKEVTVHMQQTGGLFEGAPADYRGVRIGTVKDMTFAQGQVAATITLRPGVEVPARTKAKVRSLSPVGEQYLDFQPAKHEPPWLGDGDEIPASAVDVPVAVSKTTASLAGLLDNINTQDLRTVLRELNLATQGTGDDLDSLLTSSQQLLTSLDRSHPEVKKLLRDGEKVGTLFARKAPELVEFGQSVKVLAAWFKDFDPRFRTILERARTDFPQLTALMETLQPILPPVLERLITVGDILVDREPHLRQLTRVLGPSLDRFASVFRNNFLNIDLTIQGIDQCEYGVEPRDPMSAERAAPDLNNHCPANGPRRGARNAPPPLNR